MHPISLRRLLIPHRAASANPTATRGSTAAAANEEKEGGGAEEQRRSRRHRQRSLYTPAPERLHHRSCASCTASTTPAPPHRYLAPHSLDPTSKLSPPLPVSLLLPTSADDPFVGNPRPPCPLRAQPLRHSRLLGPLPPTPLCSHRRPPRHRAIAVGLGYQCPASIEQPHCGPRQPGCRT
jgi:hypothetical protein